MGLYWLGTLFIFVSFSDLFASYNFEPLKVELHRQELHPYVVIILKSGKVSKIFII